MFAFGPFHYDAEQRLLFRQGEVVALVPKAIDTLHVLLERRGRVVEKADLMKLVWPDTTVEEVTETLLDWLKADERTRSIVRGLK